MRIALFQPDIAGNVGTILRLAACLAVPVDIIEPCGFPLGDRQLKRAAMDYGGAVEIKRHVDWDAFWQFCDAAQARIILLTSKSEKSVYAMEFTASDVLLMGSESAGVPDSVRSAVDAAVTIPMAEGFRSLNVAVATGMALGEAVRQTRYL
jgi:tRNA (cytidine/uridine-2'-O-)-methyltransferase